VNLKLNNHIAGCLRVQGEHAAADPVPEAENHQQLASGIQSVFFLSSPILKK
jgi:hypothetical protein